MVAEARARVEVLSAPAKPLDLDRQQAAARAMNVAPEVSLDLGNNVKLGVVLIPSGTFLMGSSDGEKDRSDDEGPQHEVTISKAFYMGKYEVTQEQYEAVMGKSESRFKGLTNPAEFVSWDDAQEFCKKLSAKMGRTVRLPTEAEWEYACRAGTTTPFYTGETITTDQANFAGNINYGSGQKGEYRQKTVPVGSFPPNAFGLYDMYGNVWEWCQDWYAEKYEAGAATDPGGPANGTKRVMRGSCWTNYMASCRAASRAGCEPSHASDCTGFRCVLDVK